MSRPGTGTGCRPGPEIGRSQWATANTLHCVDATCHLLRANSGCRDANQLRLEEIGRGELRLWPLSTPSLSLTGPKLSCLGAICRRSKPVPTDCPLESSLSLLMNHGHSGPALHCTKSLLTRDPKPSMRTLQCQSINLPFPTRHSSIPCLQQRNIVF